MLHSHPPSVRWFVVLAALVVVIFGLQAAASLLVPFLLSLFIAVLCFAPLRGLRARGFPNTAAVAVVGVSVALLGGSVLWVVVMSLKRLAARVPFYQNRLEHLIDSGSRLAQQWGVDLNRHELLSILDPSQWVGMLTGLASQIGGLLSSTFLVLATVVFLLLETLDFGRKLALAFHERPDTLQLLTRFVQTVQRYMLVKTWLSLLTGALVGGWLALVGVDYPLLWGLLAFLLNYIPNIGAFLATIPVALLAVLQLGAHGGLLATGGMVGINILLGVWLEPRYLGQQLGLSTLVVFVSLIFWGWVFGPVGMLLSVPLTMTAKIALDSQPRTRWLAALLAN